MTLIVNLYGGPCAGKSVVAAGVFHNLKKAGVDCEYVTEYAKDIVWEESFTKLRNQIYIFAKQHNRIFRCLNKVDVIITDSPSNLGLIYGELYTENMSPQLRDLVKYEFSKYNNFNVLLSRTHAYNANGRMQTEDEANKIAVMVRALLDEDNHHYLELNSSDDTVNIICSGVIAELDKYKYVKDTDIKPSSTVDFNDQNH